MSLRHDMTSSTRTHTLRCMTCREWKPDESFPHDAGANFVRRGRHKQCRECLTVAKRKWRIARAALAKEDA